MADMLPVGVSESLVVGLGHAMDGLVDVVGAGDRLGIAWG